MSRSNSDDGAALYRESSRRLLAAMGNPHGEVQEYLRVAGVIDNKSALMLTYLAILLAGISIFLAGGNGDATFGLGRAAFGSAMLVLFGAVFAAGFLCLSCTNRIDVRIYHDNTPEEMCTIIGALIHHRLRRFNVAYWLTVGASAAFALLVLTRILQTYFVGAP